MMGFTMKSNECSMYSSYVEFDPGTPMKNGRPVNIFPLLQGIRHPCASNKLEFEKKFCNAHRTKFCAWDTTGASNLDELRQVIGRHLIRKTKEECLDLPSLTRQLHHLQIDEGVQMKYNAIIQSMKSPSTTHSRQGQGYHSGAGSGQGKVLELLAELRQFTSREKVTGTAAVVRGYLERGQGPVVVFVWFRDTARQLQTLLTSQTITPRSMPKGAVVADSTHRGLAAVGGDDRDGTKNAVGRAGSVKGVGVVIKDENSMPDCPNIIIDLTSDDSDSHSNNSSKASLRTTEGARARDGKEGACSSEILGTQITGGVAVEGSTQATEEVARSVSCDILTGDVTKQQERQRIVDRFQAGGLDVIICSFGVGATGLTLTRSHVVVLLDRPWTPGDVMQAEDRVRRIGQKSPVIESIWIRGFSYDDKLDKLLMAKDNSTRKVICKNEGDDGPRAWFDASNSSTSGQKPTLDSKAANIGSTKGIQSYFNKSKSHTKEKADQASKNLKPTSNVDSEEGASWNLFDSDEDKAKETSIMQSLIRQLTI